MAFRKQQEGAANGPWLGRIIAGVVHLFLRVAFGFTMLAAVAAGVLYLLLSQGPIHLSYAAQIATKIFNDDTERLEVELGDVVLTLGEAGGPAGVQFVDLKVKNADGEPIFVVPRLSAKFDISDLLRGRLRPTRILLVRPEARLLRTHEGQFRFGLGEQTTAVDTAADVLVAETPQMEEISRILEGFIGDAEPPPVLSRLTEIVISGGNLTYENAGIGRRWNTKQADLRIFRTDTGLLARLSIGLADGPETGAGVVVIAERQRGGDEATRLNARFDSLRPEHLAEQLDQMQWLSLFDAPLNGNLWMTFYPDGRIEELAGRISAGAGRVLSLTEHGQPFESVELAFSYEAGLERMQISELTLASDALDTKLSGFVDFGRVADGEVVGLAGQFEVLEMNLLLPQVFAEPLVFDGGQIVAMLNFDPMWIEVGSAYLREGDLVFNISGDAWVAEDGWRTDMRAGGRNLSVEQLIQHWPLAAAKNARKWIKKNIHEGVVDELVAQMRFAGGKPEVSLDFAYSGLVSSYLGEMTPIREASGRGSLTLQEFNLQMDSGVVVPIEGAPIRLDGSSFRALDLQNKPSPAEVTLLATGPTSSILTLINEQPLGLMKKLAMDPVTIHGQGEVVAEISFPLISTLKLDGVEVEANARLFDLRLPFQIPGGPLLDVSGNDVKLNATKREMSLSGPIRVYGTPLFLGWNEYFGRGSNQRTISLKGGATPALLARFDLDTEYFTDGSAPMTLRLAQKGSKDFSFDLNADLGPAKLEITDFDWAKTPGREGQLEATGIYGNGVRVSNFRLDTTDLKMTGAVDFGPGGVLLGAQLERVRNRGLADFSLVVERTGVDALAFKLKGDRLDLALFDDALGNSASSGSNSGRGSLTVEFDLNELVVTPRVIAQPAIGTYRRNRAGDSVASLAGRLAGKVPFTAEYEHTASEPANLKVLSDDAGALLKTAGLFGGATGGKLKLKARIDPEPGTDMVGVARIKNVRISGASTFKSILDEGRVEEAASAAESGGLSFDKVRVPFELTDDVLILGHSVAKGALLAVTVEGSVDENKDEIDLVGVISPAYALTGVLDEIPLIGDILSGGKGEGVFAMTFTVSGSLESPEFSVNPLSLLTPGFLRNIFSGRARGPDEDFIDSLQREVD